MRAEPSPSSRAVSEEERGWQTRGDKEIRLTGVFHERKQYAEAERLFRDVLRRYSEVLTPEHQLVGIAKVRYGETLLAAGKRADALRELQTASAILAKQTSPPATWVERARKGLAAAGKG